MIKKDYVFPYELGDGVGQAARWEDDVLSVTFLGIIPMKRFKNGKIKKAAARLLFCVRRERKNLAFCCHFSLLFCLFVLH